jgi:Flp pilus assembly pilin Flp
MGAMGCPHGEKGEEGQGAVEYAMLLMTVALILIVAITLFGSTLGELYCRFNAALPGTTTGGCVVAITRSDYDAEAQELELEATIDGGYDPYTTLTASPGGPMHASDEGYYLTISLPDCPCRVVVSSSGGTSASVTVGVAVSSVELRDLVTN